MNDRNDPADASPMMDPPAINPYAATSRVDLTPESYAGAHRRRSSFLYRWIEVDDPIPLSILFSGWWFIQRLRVNGRLLWWKISWLRIERRITAHLPADIDPQTRPLQIEITFAPALQITRYQIHLANQTLYDGP